MSTLDSIGVVLEAPHEWKLLFRLQSQRILPPGSPRWFLQLGKTVIGRSELSCRLRQGGRWYYHKGVAVVVAMPSDGQITISCSALLSHQLEGLLHPIHLQQQQQ